MFYPILYHLFLFVQIIKKHADVLSNSWASFLEFMLMFFLVCSDS